MHCAAMPVSYTVNIFIIFQTLSLLVSSYIQNSYTIAIGRMSDIY